MAEENNQQQNNKQPAAPVDAARPASGAAPAGSQADRPRNRREFKKNSPRSRSDGKPKSDVDQKIISIRRVTRVVAGGRRFSFSVAIVAGDRKGSVGVGVGKAGDTALAIEKALKNARKNFIKISVTKDMSIPYEVSAKFSASRVTITPTPGRGVVAGSSVRSIIELAGLKNVGAKIRSSSKNRLNNARVAIEALRMLTPHRKVIMAKRKNAEAMKEGTAVTA